MRSGKLRALGVTSKERSSALPDVPPIADTVPGYYAPLLYGMWGPKGLPTPIVALWNRDVVNLLKTPDMKERMTSAGIDAAGGPPDEFREALRADVERWRKVVKAAGASVAIPKLLTSVKPVGTLGMSVSVSGASPEFVTVKTCVIGVL